MSKLLYTSADWTMTDLHRILEEAERMGVEEYGLDLYPNQVEIITSESMLDLYASHGLPAMYRHWSFGKKFARDYANYQAGKMGLAYEIVINSSPCIAYCMQENTTTMQALVISHASVGHNFFFKSNYLMRQWVDAASIVDYMVYARDFIAKCEDKYGVEAVERILDSAHALQYQGIDMHPRKQKTQKEEERRQKERARQEEQNYNAMWDLIPKAEVKKSPEEEWKAKMSLPEHNLLYFVAEYSPKLRDWQREIIRIVCKIAQYFYPNIQTKTANEGCATFVHYETMNNWLDRGQISEGNYLEFIKSHTSVITQYGAEDVYKTRDGREVKPYDGWNPYALGFAILQDVKRICLDPTAEDKEWFPQFAGSGDYWPVIREALTENRDLTVSVTESHARLPHVRNQRSREGPKVRDR
jgi:stage V sporulation protein R